MSGYQYIAFTCNDLRELPSAALLKAAFPDIQGIDIQGNPLFNCSSLANIREEIAILTDCDVDTKPIQCNVIDKDCDWKCKTLNKLRQLWNQVKMSFKSKMKEWGADETMNDISSWFSKTYEKLAATFSQ